MRNPEPVVQTIPATSTADGKTIYNAMIEFNGYTYTDTKEVVIPKIKHTITVDTVVNGSVSSDKATAHYDDTVTLTVTTDTGYQIKSVKVNGTAIEAVNGVYSFTMPDGYVTVSAEFEIEKFTVIWKNGNTTLETDENVPYGTIPSYDGETPTKEATAQYSYAFSGCTPAVDAVTGDVTYTAQFSSTVNQYAVYLPTNMEIVGIASDKYDYGTSVQFKVKTGYGASNVKTNGTDLTATDGIYTVNVTDDMTITADIVAYTPVVINSVDINGITTPTTVYKEIYASADYTVPASPYLDGYTFSGWKVNDVLYATADDVQSAVYALVKAGTPVTVAVVYTKKNETHTVSVNSPETIGCTIKDANGNKIAAGTSINVSEQLYAYADQEAPGQHFAYWLRIQGDKQTIVGYETTYAFRMPDENMVLSAVYVNNDVTVEKVGTGYIESVKRLAENKLSFVSILCVPYDCQMMKAGVVVQSTETLNGADLTTANARLKRYSDTSNNHYSSYKYTWTMTTSDYTKKWTVRPYLEYTDKNGAIQTIYGEAVSKCVNDVNYENA